MSNIILLTDSYKPTMPKQYPPKTEFVESYLESRGGVFDHTVVAGYQFLIDKYLTKRVTVADVDEADAFFQQHYGKDIFNRAGWMHIVQAHNGRLPIEIRAVPEGSVIPVSNALMVVRNTDPKCYWLTTHLETLLVQSWYPITVATQSYFIKQIIKRFLEDTGDVAGLDFKLHDFGFRGVSSVESAGIGGFAHLVNFKGTDTLAALQVAKNHYFEPMAGFSIPASEHSTITSWGREREYEAFANMLDQFPEGLVACVSDSYNIIKACEAWGSEPLKSRVLGRKGTLVVRPDSGEPATTVLEVLRTLEKGFGTTLNSKGYKVLPPQVRVIQGDGVNKDSIEDVLFLMKHNGFSADNIAFGMGGALLQQLNRDTQKFAFKCSAVRIDGEWQEVYKDPINGGKQSKRGQLRLVMPRIDEYKTVKAGEYPQLQDQLMVVYKNGSICVPQTLKSIRTRVEANRLEIKANA